MYASAGLWQMPLKQRRASRGLSTAGEGCKNCEVDASKNLQDMEDSTPQNHGRIEVLDGWWWNLYEISGQEVTT